MRGRVEVAIVGGGPAGLCAAIEAAQTGICTILVDENQKPGGQLLKQIHKFFGSESHWAGRRGIDIGRMLGEKAEESGVEFKLGSLVWGIFDHNRLGIVQNGKNFVLEAERILLATGALENGISFPGWTIPGVMGAGAMQTLVNIHRVLPGNRILMVGSGNVGLIVSYQLLQAGAAVVAVAEAAPSIGGYGVHASRLTRNGIAILTSTTVLEARGGGSVEEATLSRVDKHWRPIQGTERDVEVDAICLACGLSPLSELAWMAGCEFVYIPDLGGHVPVHDDNMQTTVPGLYVAGDLAGVEEASTAMEEGRLAGVAMAESLGHLEHQRAEGKKREIWRRLEELRAGRFSQARGAASGRVPNGSEKAWRYEKMGF